MRVKQNLLKVLEIAKVLVNLIIFMGKRYTLLLLVLILSGAVVFGYIYYMRFYIPQQSKTYQADARVAYGTFVSGDYVTSVESLPALIAQAPNKSELGRLKILLGVSYWFRDQSGDRTQAIKTLKEVVNDYSIPAVWRAQALNSIARFVNDSSLSFYQVHFNEAPYNAFVPAEGTEVQKVSAAYLALLKYSDDTYPTSWAEYSIAHQYASLSVSNPSGADPKETAEMMMKYVKDGDSRHDESIYSPSILVHGYYHRAVSLGRISFLLGSPAESVKEAEDAYALVFDTAKATGQDKNPSVIIWRARFYNANLVSSQLNREEDIRAMLQPFAEADHLSEELRFFANLKNVPETNFNKMVAIKLAKISPEFRVFLDKLGIVVN